MRRTVEVPPVGPLGQPTPLTGRLARAPTGRLAAVALVVRVAHIGMEQFTAVQTLALSSSLHLASPPRYTKHRRKAPPPPPLSDAEEDKKEDQTQEEEDKKKGGARRRRRTFSTCSVRLDHYSFWSALTT
jgi:hypothetical protein